MYQAIWCCSFLFVYQGNWEVTGKWNWSGSSEDYDSCFALYCSVHCTQVHEQASSTVQVVGKFWSLHNPQKLCMCQISYKNYKLDFLDKFCLQWHTFLRLVRNHWKKTFGFLNRLCLLISNLLPPSINRHPWFIMIQHPYFILILVLVAHTYTIHTCRYTIYTYTRHFLYSHTILLYCITL